MDQNSFLKDFMRMRQSLHKVVTGVKRKEEVRPDSVTLATIIENKPSAKVVQEYFKRRAVELEC